MRSNTRINLWLMGRILVFAAFAGALAACLASETQSEKPSGNSKCYVCHPDMKTEELTTDHLDMGVTCDECHGASTEHMHDEMLMTEPDLLFGRSEVEKMCSNPTCHKPGGGREVYGRQDHEDPVAVEAFFKKWAGRMRANGRTVAHNSVCTDCHGTHNISKPLETRSEGGQQAEWVAAFNGRDLTGWRPSGTASWTVKTGRIVGTPDTNDEGGTLWSEAVYEDYLLAVTFRAGWPIHAGIWLRGTDAKPGPRVEICEPSEADKSAAFTGSVRVPGKGLALANLREDLVDRESWNTISVKVEGERIQVWLNGEEIGAVRLIAPAKGRIGLYVQEHLPSKSTELSVREVLVQRLGDAGEEASTPSQN